MRRTYVSILIAVAVAAALPVFAATPDSGTLSMANPDVSWTSDALTGAATDPPSCDDNACDTYTLSLDVPDWYWAQHPGGVAVRIEWDDPANLIALHVYGPDGSEAAGSASTDQYRTTFQQAFVASPVSGAYRVLVQGFLANQVTVRGTARLVEQSVPEVQRAANTIRFGAPAFVDPQLWAAEPTITAGGGNLFVAAPWSGFSFTSFVWRSSDHGRSFDLLDDQVAGIADPRHRTCTSNAGGFDSDVVANRTGRLYSADLYALNVSIGYSMDGGNTWTCVPAAASHEELDREWLAAGPNADGSGPNIDAYLATRDLVTGKIDAVAPQKPIALHLDVTRDGGLTWQEQGLYAPDLVSQSGRLFAARDGTVYHVFYGNTTVYMASSQDDGNNFVVVPVSERLGSPGNAFVTGDVDDAGNVYAAWVDAGTYDVLYSVSTDKGRHWSAPLRVSPPQSGSTMLPWLVARGTGDVAIAWIGTSATVRPDTAPAGTPWYAWVARSQNANSRTPSFESTTMSETPMHFGAICPMSGVCSDDRLKDFFAITFDDDGTIVAVFDDNGRMQADATQPGPYVMVARQESGLGTAHVKGSGSGGLGSERRGDARYPRRTGSPVPQLDFATAPAATWTSSSLKLTIPISSAGGLGTLLAAGNALNATDAYWIALWKANNRVEYAGMHLDSNGATDFFGGDEPVGVDNPEQGDKAASYPATFTLNGHVDETTGKITIDVPFSEFHLKQSDVIHSLQAFSMIGLTSTREPYNLLQTIDATPSHTFPLVPKPAPGRRGPRARVLASTAMLPATGLGDPWETALAFLFGAVALTRYARRRVKR